VEGNEWDIGGLLKKIEETSPVKEIAKHSLVQNIYEYCIENIIDKQAEEFYSDFKIKEKLIEDYKNMEHERRRDDFERFCLSMYQQIELIMNKPFKDRIAPNRSMDN